MLKKRYISQGKICKVTFTLPPHLDPKSAALVGDFNNWDKEATPMQQAKDGAWQVELRLEAGHEYQYRYYVDSSEWHNDWEADKYVMHPYGGENSVVVT